ncbi:MAG TPA: P1 family peptidase [Caldimonas sp.]|jgi:putative pantetheine hydrolase|nr:P1 family peptidase [Caldimonas sp.]HEX2540350.1 P1 family peptidase [Caldimonas sp.]
MHAVGTEAVAAAHRAALLVACAMACIAWSTVAAAQETRRHGPNNAITDVEGILVGHHERTDGDYQTGVTVVWAPGQAVGSVYVGGGWPGTINTDVLQPARAGQKIDVAFMTGGSYYGLRAFGGIMEWLEQGRYGMPSLPGHVNPLVAGAVVWDLNRGGAFDARPTQEFGVAAMKAARSGPVAQGNVGAGAGTRAFGGLALKGGVGTASAVFGGITVGVIAVVNAAGTPVDLQDCSLRGTFINVQNEFAGYRSPSKTDCDALKKVRNIPVSSSGLDTYRFALASADADDGSGPHANTTLSVVATNAVLTKAQALQLAVAVNNGNAAVIQPFNTGDDGDAVFAMATGKVDIDTGRFETLLTIAKEVAGRSIAHAMLKATSARTLQSYCDALPSACRR